MSQSEIDWSECHFVEMNVGVQASAAVLVGTTMPADAIVENFDHGVSPAEIAQQFELSLENTDADLTYAQSHRVAHRI